MPPLQKKASILPSRSAPTDCEAPRLWRRMSCAGFTPAASRMRNALISVPLPGAPVETMRPARSGTARMPVPSSVTTWLWLS